jgi:hypothetical protein
MRGQTERQQSSRSKSTNNLHSGIPDMWLGGYVRICASPLGCIFEGSHPLQMQERAAKLSDLILLSRKITTA